MFVRIEEERAPCYLPRHYYPVRLHQTLNNRYQIAAKLGWGTSSTVWLARDLYQWRWSSPSYVAVKINTNNHDNKEAAETELRITRHITESNPQHPGHCFVRTLLASFDLQVPSGCHVCMVLEPLHDPLWLLKQRFQGNVLPPNVVKLISKLVLEGLHYLHSECHVIHTDLKSDNILMALRDKSVLDAVAHDEIAEPIPLKKLEDRTIYLSRNDFGLQGRGSGRSVITDFGLAVHGDKVPLHRHPIQPDEYRAPEVILDSGWTYSADIWNLGAVEVIANGKERAKYIDEEGKFKFPELIPDSRGMEDSLHHIQGEEKMAFLDFMSKMLHWKSEARSTAQELLSDPWLSDIE
ncbi:kinase-like protein [Aspergillus californicus]